jgi:hypothetical protein
LTERGVTAPSLCRVLPELLVSLPHDDPAARRSRDELRLINRIMGKHELQKDEVFGDKT